jgi:autotransporter-associated beta strand protein
VRVTPLGLLDTSSPYRLVDYSGTLAGNFTTVVVVNASYTATLDTNTTGQINVSFVSTSRSLVWAGGPSNWDVAVSAAWNTNADVFLQGDSVTFDDSAPSNQTVVLSGTVIPMSVTVVGTSNYVLTGAGKISGGGPITKDGAGVLTIATTNDFSGEFVISNGVRRSVRRAARPR